MPTIRSELSAKNPYAIPKERYLELKHFCAQVPAWRSELREFHTITTSVHTARTHNASRPTENAALNERVQMLTHWVMIFEHSIVKSLPRYCGECGMLIIRCFEEAVIGNCSYDKLAALHPDISIVPRDVWYESYRRFFWLLDKSRK